MKFNVTHDAPVTLATGKSRKELKWKNQTLPWSELVERLSRTHRTAETFADYLKSPKGRQDEIKDIGGFVGGHLVGGRRKATAVHSRSLVTLDIDFGTPETWDDFTLIYGCAAVLYSTHKHEPNNPRYRLILPLDREVFAEEYVAISRRVAGNLGIEQFDNTTFEPSRLMYWPSTASDAEYVFRFQDGPFLSADETLATYRNWQDAAEWPVSRRHSEAIQRAAKKQGDPLEKSGVIGAFCRTYTIGAAIEKFIPDVYEPTDQEGRYSFRQGSTAGGLVLYDEKFAYSHHGTDPCGGKLVNSFDLIRIHKFGLKDEDAAPSTTHTKLPSYRAMMDLAAADPETRKAVASELIGSAVEAFAGVGGSDLPESPEEPADENWQEKMQVDRQGKFVSSIENIYLVLKNHSGIRGALYLNEFENRLIVTRDLPWRPLSDGADFSDADEDCLCHFLEGMNVPFTQVTKALSRIKQDRKIHPVRQYLAAQVWDGRERVATLFSDYLGAQDSDYTREVAKIVLSAAVARVMQPGVKFDTMPVLVGPEGIGKSTLFAKLARSWFSDCLGDLHGKEAMESLRGVWIMEVAELSGFKKADEEAIKRFISSTEDVYRPAYGRQLVRFPRQCIFIGTTNEVDFLRGAHAHRRFLPILSSVAEPEKDVFADLTESEIGQIWAEAVQLYQNGQPLILPASMSEEAARIRESHTEKDDREGTIQEYLDLAVPKNWSEMKLWDRRDYFSKSGETDGTFEPGELEVRDRICVAEIWCEAFHGVAKDMNRQSVKFIHDYMKKCKNWRPFSKNIWFGQYGGQKGYFRVKTNLTNR